MILYIIINRMTNLYTSLILLSVRSYITAVI